VISSKAGCWHVLRLSGMCLCAETQEGPAPVTDDAAAGEEADPAGTLSSDAAGSSAGKTTSGSLTIRCASMTVIYTTTTTTILLPHHHPLAPPSL